MLSTVLLTPLMIYNLAIQGYVANMKEFLFVTILTSYTQVQIVENGFIIFREIISWPLEGQNIQEKIKFATKALILVSIIKHKYHKQLLYVFWHSTANSLGLV